MEFEHDQATRQSWDQLAERYRAAFMDLDLYDDSYDALCARVSQVGARVLEVGCGPGNVTRALLQRRPDFRIHAIDYAPSMVALARTLVPGATFDVMDARAIGSLATRFEAAVVGFCLPYLSSDAARQLIHDAARLLVPGGVLYLSTIASEVARSGYETSSKGDARMYVHYHPTDDLMAAMTAAGFSGTEVLHLAYTKADGTPSTHVVLLGALAGSQM
jgi:ubiquinone/menaquinone biosynthesis C-methylase UbiE